MKIVSVSVSLCFMVLSSIGCVFSDSYYKSENSIVKNRIVVGCFERRNYEIDPSAEKSFKELLRFEFLKNDYQCEIIPVVDYINDQETISKIMEKYNADVYVQGYFVLNTIGTAFSSDNYSMISVSFFDYKKIISEIHHFAQDDLTRIDNIREASSVIVNEFVGRNVKLDKKNK